jgi:hypothetical protein
MDAKVATVEIFNFLFLCVLCVLCGKFSFLAKSNNPALVRRVIG